MNPLYVEINQRGAFAFPEIHRGKSLSSVAKFTPEAEQVKYFFSNSRHRRLMCLELVSDRAYYHYTKKGLEVFMIVKIKHRSPSYPGINLETAVARAKVFFAAERNHEALVSTAAMHWKYAPKSSGGLTTISALKAYGLMSDRGNGEERKVRLTALGLSIAQDERQISPERDAAIKEAALKPKVIMDLLNKFSFPLPSHETLAHYLKVDKEFNPKVVDDVIKIYKETVEYAGLDSFSEGDHDDHDEMQETGDELQGEAQFTPNQSLDLHTSPTPERRSQGRAETGEEIANIRVSRSTTVRLIANGPYSRQSIEALVAQLKLGLDLGTYDDLPEE